MARRYVLLPGLDGTGSGFADFIGAAPTDAAIEVVALPVDRPRSYEELADFVVARLPQDPSTLIAESFSGPLGVLVAARATQLEALVLCATFLTSPAPSVLARAPDALLGVVPPRALFSKLLAGGDDALAARVRASLATVPQAIIASRVRAVLRVDVRAALTACTIPTLALVATRDRLVGRAHARELARHAMIAEIDAPHLVLQAAPHAAWRHVLRVPTR